MTKIGVVTRGKYGRRLIETIESRTCLDVISTDIPEHLPDFIEEPEEFLENTGFDKDVLKADIIMTYSLHPDLTPEIARMAAEAGSKAVIIPGGPSRAPVRELEKIAEEYGIHIEVEDICCTLKQCPYTSELTAMLGIPSLSIKTKDGKISDIEVIRGAPCGSTWHMAEELIGTQIEDAPAKAGLLIQQYPCRAVRGTLGGIHESAEIHKKAVTAAIKREGDSNKE